MDSEKCRGVRGVDYSSHNREGRVENIERESLSQNIPDILEFTLLSFKITLCQQSVILEAPIDVTLNRGITRGRKRDKFSAGVMNSLPKC